MKKFSIVITYCIAIALLVGCALLRYDEIITAWMWHKTHGNNFEFGEVQVAIPSSWSVTSETKYSAVITEALPGPRTTAPSIRIEIARPEEISSSDDQALKRAKHHPQGGSKDTVFHTSDSVKIIASPTRTFYCERTELSVINSVYDLCRAPRFGYVINYKGDKATEVQAENIIADIRMK